MRQKNTAIMEHIIQYVDDYYKRNLEMPSLTEIGREVQLDKANVYRYLVDMRDKGMVEYDGKFIGTSATRKFKRERILAAHVGSIRCGSPEYEEEHIDAYYSLPEAIFGQGEFYILTAKGDSMVEAGIEEGDLVVVRKTQQAEKGDIVVALLNGENTLKRYLTVSGRPVLHPENKLLEDIPIQEEDEFYIQGIATHTIKHLSSSVDRLK